MMSLGELEVTVNANVPNRTKQDKLLDYVKNSLGYDTCEIDAHNNTVRVYNLGGIDKREVMKFIRKNIDKTRVSKVRGNLDREA